MSDSPPLSAPPAGPTTAATPSPAGFQLRLHPGVTTLVARPDQTLWQALQAAGVAWPVSCRNGSCRTCLGVLLGGQVRYTVEWPGLLPEEKTQGCVLPCVACATSDVVLARS